MFIIFYISVSVFVGLSPLSFYSFGSICESYNFDESHSIERKDPKVTSNFRRVLSQVLAVAAKNLVLFGMATNSFLSTFLRI